MSQAMNKEVGFVLSAAFPITSMFDDPQISLYYNLKHYDLKLRLN